MGREGPLVPHPHGYESPLVFYDPRDWWRVVARAFGVTYGHR